MALHNIDTNHYTTDTLQCSPDNVTCIHVHNEIFYIIEGKLADGAEPCLKTGLMFTKDFFFPIENLIQSYVHQSFQDMAGIGVCADDAHLF